MAVDRGGLQYTISVRDQFSRETARFRTEMSSAKKAFRDFQDELRKGGGAAKSFQEQNKLTKEQITLLRKLDAEARALRAREQESVRIRNAQQRDSARASNERAAAERARIQAERQAARATEASQKAELRRAEEIVKRAQERERIAQRLAVAHTREQASIEKAESRAEIARERARKAAVQRDPRIQAQRQLNAELLREQIVREKITLLQRQGRAQIGGGDIIGGTKTLRAAKELEQSLKNSSAHGNSLFFTFRRIIGVLAVFTLARRGVQTFNELVVAGVRFNDTVEKSTLGVAGLVAAIGDVRSDLGLSVDSAEELDLALGAARDQVLKLRQDSLRTTATFEELLETFQVAVGPGLAAGLNLDEIRELTVDISQAAQALSIPQNQLAEEIRSLLSGTIQARTTRIATALGITNEDIRQMKEAGELFSFLEDRIGSFAEAAERAARETLTGVATLASGALQEVLGEAARPLFDELLSILNEVFDEVLTIKDAAGRIRPNPAAVEAFRGLFDALTQGLQKAREFARVVGFEGLQDGIAAFGTALVATIEFGLGAAKALFVAFNLILKPIQAIARALGLTNEQLGTVAGAAGVLVTTLFLANKALSLFGLNLSALIPATTKLVGLFKLIPTSIAQSVGSAAALLGIFVLIGKGIEFVLEKIFGVELGLRDTIELVALGLVSAWFEVAGVIKTVGTTISSAIGGALDSVISAAKQKALEGRAFVNSLFGDDEEAQALIQRRDQEQVAQQARESKRRKALELELADIRLQTEAKVAGVQAEIAKKIGDKAAEQSQGEGFDPAFDPKAASDAAKAGLDVTGKAADEFTTIISTADQAINDLGNDLLKLSEDLRVTKAELAQGAQLEGGPAAGIDNFFREEEIASGERLRKLTLELNNVRDAGARIIEKQQISDERLLAINEALKLSVDERKKALEALDLTAAEGQLVSLLRDEKDIRDGIREAEQASFDLALAKAAVSATNALPALREETRLLQAQVAAERAITAALLISHNSRQQAVVEAQAAVQLAEIERNLAQEKADIEVAALQARVSAAPPGEERAALESVLEALIQRRDLEQEILNLRIQQLAKAKEEAELVANGSLTEGLKKGFLEFAEQFGSTFRAGVEIAKQSTAALAQFISTSIVDAFDPTKEFDLKERFARFMQQIAGIILQQLVQLAIAKAILGFKDGGVVPELNVAGQTFRHGGPVKRHGGRRLPAHAFAQGFAGGGAPTGISPLDTVPAMLRPGEFVMSKESVDRFGLGTFAAMNQGNFPVTGSSAAEAAGPSMGMQTGGLVSDQLSDANAAAASSSNRGETVLPILVAKDREMDQLTAGGKNAMLAFMRDNAGSISSLLDRGGRR